MSTSEAKKSDEVVAPEGTKGSAANDGKALFRPGVAAKPMAQPFNAMILLKALRYRWLGAVVLGVLVAGAVGAAVWFFLPPAKYAASVKIRVQARPEGTLFEHPEARTDFNTFEQTQIGLLKTQMVLTAALRQSKVAQLELVKQQPADRQVAWLEQQLHIDFPDGPEIMRLTISSDDMETCKTLANAVASAYLQETESVASQQRRKHLDELHAVTEKYQTRVDSLRKDMRTKAEAVGSSDTQVLALQQRMARELAEKARHDLVEIESRLRTLENQSEIMKGQGPGSAEVSSRLVDSMVDRRPEVAALLEQKAQIETEIQLMKPNAVGGENHPEVRKLIDKAVSLTKEINDRRRALRTDAVKALKEDSAAAGQEKQAEVANEIVEANGLRKRLLSDIERLDKDSKEYGKVALDVEYKKPEIDQAAAVADRALQKEQEAAVEQFDPFRVTSWEEAVVTRPDENDRKIKMAGLGAAGGFVGTLLLVSLLEYRTRRVRSPQELVQGLGLNLVGTVPARPRFRGGNGDARWQNLLAESVDSARTMLIHAAQSPATKVVLVTSAVGGEGKTSLAGHLAVSLARAGLKTLLIDGDLRNPATHRIFNLEASPGFSELLRGEAGFVDVLQQAAFANMMVISAGKCDQKALAALSQNCMRELFARMREEFDVILFDSSPVLPVADSLQLARHADGVLFSVLQNVSTLPLVYEAYHRIEALGVAMLGVVVSGAAPEVTGYGRERYLNPPVAAN